MADDFPRHREAAYVDRDIHEFLSAEAEEKSVDVDELISELLKRDIAIIETAGYFTGPQLGAQRAVDTCRRHRDTLPSAIL
jgi:hypothetical protein